MFSPVGSPTAAPTARRRRGTLLLAGGLLWGAFLSYGLVGFAGDGAPAPVTLTGLKVSPLDAQLLGDWSAAGPTGVPGDVFMPSDGEGMYVPLHIEFKSPAARLQFRAPQGVTLFNEYDRFADAFLDLRQRAAMAQLEAMKEIAWMDVDAQIIRLPPPPKITEGKEEIVRAFGQIVRGGFQGMTGKGVVICVVDDGIDYRHKDFITYDESGQPTSRILYFWDTFANSTGGKIGSPAPFKYPNGASIGTVYTREELTEELRKPTNTIIVDGGHGTPCTGIAAGNGNARKDKRYTGVAPDADIIAVRIGRQGPWNQYLLAAACAFADEKAGKKPLVVSCSFGHPQQGTRDGSRVIERQLDARFAFTAKGRAICIAAGNEGVRGAFPMYHGVVEFGGEEAKATLPFRVNFASRSRITLQIQTKTPADVMVKVKYPDATMHRFMHPLSGSLIVEINLPIPKGGGAAAGEVELYTKGRDRLRADAYLDTEPWVGGSFSGPGASKVGYIRSPGSMLNAITVGSYDFNAIDDRFADPKVINDSDGRPMIVGQLSSYSSNGNDRPGVVKPTIVSPGQWHFSAQTSSPSFEGYMQFNGTSAATPYTAGLVALMFQKKGDLTLGELQHLLISKAAVDATTGRVPNPRWGHGRLSVDAVDRIFKAIP
jgi:subtilisin family serine protease